MARRAGGGPAIDVARDRVVAEPGVEHHGADYRVVAAERGIPPPLNRGLLRHRREVAAGLGRGGEQRVAHIVLRGQDFEVVETHADGREVGPEQVHVADAEVAESVAEPVVVGLCPRQGGAPFAGPARGAGAAQVPPSPGRR